MTRVRFTGPRPRPPLLTTMIALIVGVGLPPQASGAPPQHTIQAPTATRPEAYQYNPEGRRDPFVSLLAAGLESRPSGPHSEGLAGLSVSEMSVRGIVQSRGGFVAMVQGPDARTYIVHTNDLLLDGRVSSITAQDLVITQEVNAPLSLVKQREVRKPLRLLEEGK